MKVLNELIPYLYNHRRVIHLTVVVAKNNLLLLLLSFARLLILNMSDTNWRTNIYFKFSKSSTEVFASTDCVRVTPEVIERR